MAKYNASEILQTILKYNEGISMATIAKETMLSPATISRMLKFLQEKEIIVDDGKEDSVAGRKTQLFTINRHYKYIVSVVIEKTATIVCLADLKGGLLTRKLVPMKALGTGLKILENICAIIVDLVQQYFGSDSAMEKIEVIGIGVSGLIDEKKETVINAAHIPGWKNVEIVKFIEDKLHVSTFVDSTNHISIMGGQRSYQSDNIKNLVYLTISTGIGMGIMINNKLFYGSHGMAGEIRNMAIGNAYPLGVNRYGVHDERLSWLEEQYGTQKIYREAIHYLEKNRNSILYDIFSKLGTDYEDIENMKMTYIDQAAQRGDEGCIRLLYEPIQVWAGMLINIICCIDPDAVIVGGGDVHAGTPYILNLLQEIVHDRLGFPIIIIGDEEDRLTSTAAINHSLNNAYTKIVTSLNKENTTILEPINK